MTTQVIYSIDQTGLLPSNLIENEIHTTTIFNDRSFHILTPFYAPFFEESLVVVRKVGLTTTTLTRGADYSVAIPHMMSPTTTGKKLYSAIVIHDVVMSAVFEITYQTFGGGFNFDQSAVIEQVSQKVYGDKTYDWSDVGNKSDIFPVDTHVHDVNSINGLSPLVNALDAIDTTVNSTNIDPVANKVFTGDLSGSGTNNITLTLNNTPVTPGTYNKVVVGADGRVLSGTQLTSINDYNMAFTYIEEPQIISTIANYTVAPLSHKGAGGSEHADVTTTTAGFMSASDKAMLDNATSYPISNIAPLPLGTAAAGVQNILSRADHVHALPASVSTTADGLMSAADKAKLDGIEAGAQVNSIFDVNSKTGAVTFTATEFNLGNVDNTSDANKPVSTAQQTALDAKQDKYVDFSLNTAGILALDATAHTGEVYKATDTLIEYISNGTAWVNPLDSGGGGSITSPIIRAPIPLYPLNGQLDVVDLPLLSAFQHSPLYVSDIRIERQFQVTLATDTTFSTPYIDVGVNSDDYTLTQSLTLGTSYIWRCRDRTLTPSGIINSDWSTYQSFTIASIIIATPSILTMTGSPSSVKETPAITTSAFSVNPSAADTHVSTTWIIMNSSGAIIYTNANDTVNKTSWTIPSGILQVSTGYKLGVKYNGGLKNSSFSIYTFTTSFAFSYENYLAVAHGNSTFISIYGEDVDLFTKLSNPNILPPGTANAVSFSQDSNYLALVHNSTVFPATPNSLIYIYKRSGDTFTKLADPATLPNGNGQSCHFSSDGTYLAVGHASFPFITIYKRSGDTFTKLADPATLPTGVGFGCHFSPDSNYLAVAHINNPRVTIYKRSGDTFTKLADPATLPTGSGISCCFSPDSTYVVLGLDTRAFLIIYKRSGDTFTKLPDPATMPPGAPQGCSFSPDGNYLAVAHLNSPYITIYKRSGDVFTKLANPATLPTSTGNSCSFSPDGNYLAVVCNQGASTLVIYKRSGDTFTKLADPATLFSGDGNGCSWYQIGYGAKP